MSRRVPFFDYPAQFRFREQEYLATIRDVLSSGRFILQRELEEFEANLADFLGARFAFGVGNGTDAILIALKASGVAPGDEVILPSHTFIATASAVVHAGAKPVLVDVGADHLMDASAVASAITSSTRAILPVQLNGRTCRMDSLRALADEHGLIIVEDSAQALGSEYQGRKAGTFGKAGTFSFYPAKLLGAFGDGGAVVTDDPAVAERVRRLRDHGRTEEGEIREWSYNSRLDNVQAAILDVRLKTFAEDVKRRRDIARHYNECLCDFPGLHLPPAPENHPHFDVYQNYEIELDLRDRFRAFLEERGVGTIIQWGGKAIHQFESLGLEAADLPNTDRVMARSVLLPMHPFLTDEDVEYVCDTIESFYEATHSSG